MAKVRPSLRTTRKRADALVRSGKLKEAHALYTSACGDHPSAADLWLSLASLNRSMGLYPETEQCARHVLSIQPCSDRALVEYGAALQCQGRTDEAVSAYKKALEFKPDSGEAHYFLAGACLERGLTEQAITHYRKTIEIYPAHIEALNNLSAILTGHGMIQESMELLERALKIKPNAYHMMINLARSHLLTGNSGKALEILRRVTRVYPNSAEAHSKYLLCVNYLPQPDPQNLYEEHRRWGEMHTKNLACYTRYENPIDPERPLRIAYLSPDLRAHSVAHFIEPVLAHHDRSRFLISCYADVENPDDTSQRLASLCDDWRWTAQLSNEQLCERIHNDRIDILVDLAGHTATNRLPAFARKPAPLAISYLGYPNTTGLGAIDYRLTDSIADPPEVADRYYTEKLVRLPNGFLCYQPPDNTPDTSTSSGRNCDGIVFGSFNNLAKITPEVIQVWSGILNKLNSSQLLLKNKAASDPYTRSRLIDLFLEHGVNQDRLVFLGHTEGCSEHLGMYKKIDIALDTFPYNGTTTTCEALWMGVPVVTLYGNVHASRVSASLLSRLELHDLITRSQEEYIGTAVNLASQPGLLTELRESLRNRMRYSSLCDAALITSDIENAYTQAWQTYCQGILK